jgi:hypothetical protein
MAESDTTQITAGEVTATEQVRLRPSLVEAVVEAAYILDVTGRS